jgi:LemA protein
VRPVIPNFAGNYHCPAARFGETVRELKQRKFMMTGIMLAEPGTLALSLVALIILGGLLVVAIVVGLMVMGIYNKLVTMRNRYKNAYAQIDVQLKRRYDLIPNLVETAKGYMAHERGTLEAVTQARNIAYGAAKAAAENPGDATAMKNLAAAETGLGGTLSRLMMVSEQYPDLKANQNMMQLTEELTSTENKISFARQAYNDSVMTYNTDREVFPSNLIAGMFNFGAAELFVVDKPEEKEAPKVKFT